MWRVVTYLVTHMGLFHVALAVYVQLRFCTFLEGLWGTRVFVQVFFAAGVAGGVYSAVCIPDGISAGASGALYGVCGASVTYWALHLWEGDDAMRAWRLAQFKRLLVGVAFLVLVSFIPHINWAAHIFGMISGALLAVWLFAALPTSLPQPPAVVRTARVCALAAYSALLLAGLVALFTAGTQPRNLLHLCEDIVKPAHPGFTCYSP